MEPLKVVSIGGYGHTVFVLDDMKGMDEAQLVGLAPAYENEDISIFANHEISQGVKTYDNYADMIRDTGADVAIISSRLDVIPQVTIEAANMGCHLIVEKPLALDHATLQKVYDAVKSNKVKMTAMLSMRSEGAFQAARKAYLAGEVGEAILVNGRKSYKWGVRPEWFGDRKLYGGTIGWVGIHAFDFINYVTGLSFTEVAAMGGNFCHPERKECEDNVAICFGLSNGGHGSASVDLLRPGSADTHGDDWIRIVGAKGVIEANGCKETCEVINEDKGKFNCDIPPRGQMFKEFLLSIRDNRELEFSAPDSFMLTDVCLAARDAMDNKTVVAVDSSKWSL